MRVVLGRISKWAQIKYRNEKPYDTLGSKTLKAGGVWELLESSQILERERTNDLYLLCAIPMHIFMGSPLD